MTAKKCTKKRDRREEVLFLPIRPNIRPKVPNDALAEDLRPRALFSTWMRGRSHASSGLTPDHVNWLSSARTAILFLGACWQGETEVSRSLQTRRRSIWRMSWQTYVDTNLVGTGKVQKAAIFGLDGSQWATSAGFTVSAICNALGASSLFL